MVQQVQQGVINTPETTLETIEAVGTSSKKLIDGRQTTGEHFVGGCTASGSVHWGYNYHTGNRRSGTLQGNLGISTTRGPRTFSIVDKGIRVPKGGTYRLDLTWSGGGNFSTTIYIKKGTSFSDETIYTATSAATISKTLTLGKFDTITLRGEFYYYGSSDYASGVINVSSLTLTEL